MSDAQAPEPMTEQGEWIESTDEAGRRRAVFAPAKPALPDAYEIMRLADAYAKAEAARHIPTGDLYRSITHDDWVKKRDALYTALAAQAEAHAAEVAWLTADRDALRADAERLREFDAWLDDRAGPLLHIDDVRAARTGSKT